MTPMSDTNRTSSPGRPKVYASDSDRITAWRSRLGDAGYLRKEVLVTKATADSLTLLAKAHGVKLTDAASALLEYGLDKFVEEHGLPGATAIGQEEPAVASLATAPLGLLQSATPQGAQFGAAAAAGTVRTARVGAAPQLSTTAVKPDALNTAQESNPILRFFANRKQESQK